MKNNIEKAKEIKKIVKKKIKKAEEKIQRAKGGSYERNN